MLCGVVWRRVSVVFTRNRDLCSVDSGLFCVVWSGGGNSANAFGGRGGYVEAVLPTTPGETLFLIVGKGGTGIGADVNYLLNSGGGGGGTAVLRGTTPLVVAGGGGGAGSDAGNGFSLVRTRRFSIACLLCRFFCDHPVAPWPRIWHVHIRYVVCVVL